MEYGIIVHGGAWSIPDNTKSDHLKGVKFACKQGIEMLASGRDGLDVVEKVISILEDDPTFDAGIGSHLNHLAEVEMDAIIATEGFKIGSVSAIQNVQNPITLARKVMAETEHVMLVGHNATKFALDHGVQHFPTDKLLVGRERETFRQLQAAKIKSNYKTKDPFNPKKEGYGTVGCVVKDKSGYLSIGVSTGGTPHKLAGRVGDTPIWGAGGYVMPTGGVVATGYGEDLIRVLISQKVVSLMDEGKSAQEAAEIAIKQLEDEVGGLGGVICLSKNEIGLAFNTKRMAFACQTSGSELFTGIEREDLDRFLINNSK